MCRPRLQTRLRGGRVVTLVEGRRRLPNGSHLAGSPLVTRKYPDRQFFACARRARPCSAGRAGGLVATLWREGHRSVRRGFAGKST